MPGKEPKSLRSSGGVERTDFYKRRSRFSDQERLAFERQRDQPRKLGFCFVNVDGEHLVQID